MTTYTISDGNAHETHETFAALREAAESWYEYMTEDERYEASRDQIRDALAESEIDAAETVEALQSAIDSLEARLASIMGHGDWHGHGSYSVRAADQAGLCLIVGDAR